MKGELDILSILDKLPHRYPFLLVDRVLALESGKCIKALKNVTYNEPFFQGHFPAAPVMPGVLIIEALAQAGGVLAAITLKLEKKRTPIYFMTIDNVKFRIPVVPGDQLILDLTILKQRGKVIKLAGKALVDEKVVAEAELMATIGEEK